MRRALVLGLGGVAVAAAVAVVLLSSLSASRREAALRELLARAEAALEPPEGEGNGEEAAGRILLELEGALQRGGMPEGLHRRLAVAAARLELAQGRLSRAATRLGPLLTGEALTIEEARLLGEVHERLYFLRGEPLLGETSLLGWRRALEITGEASDVYRALRMAGRLGREELARFLEERIAAKGDTVYGRRLAAQRALEEERYDEALGMLRELARDFPREPEYLVQTAQCLLHRALAGEGDSQRAFEAARQDLEEALALFPHSIDGRSALAATYHTLGEKALRDAHLDWLLENARRHPNWLQWEAMRRSPLPAGGSPRGR